MDEERRKIPRLRALKAARIFYNHGASSRDCMIRNLSFEGAKLVMETTVGLPDDFVLVLEDGAQHHCGVRWRKINEMGVEFA